MSALFWEQRKIDFCLRLFMLCLRTPSARIDIVVVKAAVTDDPVMNVASIVVVVVGLCMFCGGLGRSMGSKGF